MEVFKPGYIAIQPDDDHPTATLALATARRSPSATSLARAPYSRTGVRRDGAGHADGQGAAGGDITPPGYYVLWLIDSAGQPCIQVGTLRIGRQRLHVDFDHIVFSIYDVQRDAIRQPKRQPTHARFSPCSNEVLGLTPAAAVCLTATLSTYGSIVNPALKLPR